jgi:hypothetical protein
MCLVKRGSCYLWPSISASSPTSNILIEFRTKEGAVKLQEQIGSIFPKKEKNLFISEEISLLRKKAILVFRIQYKSNKVHDSHNNRNQH